MLNFHLLFVVSLSLYTIFGYTMICLDALPYHISRHHTCLRGKSLRPSQKQFSGLLIQKPAFFELKETCRDLALNNQVIQSVTFFISVLEVTYNLLEGHVNSPYQKGYQQNCQEGVGCNLFSAFFYMGSTACSPICSLIERGPP